MDSFKKQQDRLVETLYLLFVSREELPDREEVIARLKDVTQLFDREDLIAGNSLPLLTEQVMKKLTPPTSE